MSIGAKMPPPKKRGRAGSDGPEQELISQLEKSRQEYENLKIQKEKIERSKHEQHLETTIEMRETIELLKEESLMKNELLSKYERQQNKTDEEVSKQG